MGSPPIFFDSTLGYPGEGPPALWGMRKKRGWYDKVQRHMAAVQTHKGDNIFGNRQGRPVTYNHAVSNVTALNVMHQRPDAPPMRAWWAELHAQQALVAVVSDHGLSKGRLIATEIQAGELWIGKECDMKAAWAHTAARQVTLESGAVQHHGGVSVGIHPVLSRYAVPKGEIQDRRNWGRYCGIKPSGERRPNEDGQRSDHSRENLREH